MSEPVLADSCRPCRCVSPSFTAGVCCAVAVVLLGRDSLSSARVCVVCLLEDLNPEG